MSDVKIVIDWKQFGELDDKMKDALVATMGVLQDRRT